MDRLEKLEAIRRNLAALRQGHEASPYRAELQRKLHVSACPTHEAVKDLHSTVESVPQQEARYEATTGSTASSSGSSASMNVQIADLGRSRSSRHPGTPEPCPSPPTPPPAPPESPAVRLADTRPRVEPRTLKRLERPKTAPVTEQVWRSIELKVFLRRSDLEDMFGMLREQYPDLTLPQLLAIPEEELWRLKGCRRLSHKRLLQAVAEEKRRRPLPREVKEKRAPESSESQGVSHLLAGSATEMVTRLLACPAPAAPPDWRQWEMQPERPASDRCPELPAQATPSRSSRGGCPDVPAQATPCRASRGGYPEAPAQATPSRSSRGGCPDVPAQVPLLGEGDDVGAPAWGAWRSVTPEAQGARPQTRRARIRELLKRLNLAQTPCTADVVRVDARQRLAKERHLRNSTPSTGALSPALSLRRSRSFMDLIATGAPDYASCRTAALDPATLDDVLSRLPASTVGREPCTVCLEIPSPGEGVTTLLCGHSYHTECIREWLLHARVCPLCKALVVPEELGI